MLKLFFSAISTYLLQLCVCFWFFWNECFPHLRNISDPKKMKLRENNVSGKIQTTKYDVCFLVSLLDRILDGKSGDDKLVWKINVIFRRLSEHLKIWYRVSNYRVGLLYALVCKGHAFHRLFSYIIMKLRHETNCWSWFWV